MTTAGVRDSGHCGNQTRALWIAASLHPTRLSFARCNTRAASSRIEVIQTERDPFAGAGEC